MQLILINTINNETNGINLQKINNKSCTELTAHARMVVYGEYFDKDTDQEFS